MNPGHTIFKKMQRLQRGTENLEPGPLPPEKRLIGPKERAGIYDPGEQSDEDYNARLVAEGADEDDLLEEALQRRRRTAYKTVGVNINDQEVEIPIWDEDMTPEQAEDAARDRLELGLSPFASDMELEAALKANGARLDAQPYSDPTPIPGNYARGTSNVGLGIFKNAQHLQEGVGDFSGNSYYRWLNEGGYEPGILPGNQPIEPDYTPQTPSTVGSGGGGNIPPPAGINNLVPPPNLPGVQGPMWYPGINLPPAVRTILNTNPYYQAVKAGVIAPQILWRLGGTIGKLMNKLFPGGPSQQQQPQQPGSGGGSGYAGGTDPWGNPDTKGIWSDDFGRGMGGPSLSSAGGTKFGQFGTGFGTGTVGNFATAIGFGGSYGGGSNAGDTSRFASAFGYSKPYTEAQYNAPTSSHGTGQGPGYQLGPGWTPRASYQQYLQGFHPIGTVGSSTGPGGAAYQPFGPKGIGGGTPAFKPANQKAFAMGTSDVNPGLKLFHKQQLKRKKP